MEGKLVTAIIDMGCLGVIVSKGFINRLGLIADYQIDFTLNKDKGTAEKQCLVFEKVEITVGKHSVCLLAIVVDGGHFDVLLGLTRLRKSGLN